MFGDLDLPAKRASRSFVTITASAELLVWSETDSCPKTSGLRPQHCLGPCRRESSTLWLSTALISWIRRSYCMARTMYTALQWSQHQWLETSFAVCRGPEWRTHWTDVSVNCSWSKVIVVTDVVFTYFLQNDFRCKVLACIECILIGYAWRPLAWCAFIKIEKIASHYLLLYIVFTC